MVSFEDELFGILVLLSAAIALGPECVYEPLAKTIERRRDQCHPNAFLHAMTLWLWANIDPGSDEINRTIRMHREYVGN